MSIGIIIIFVVIVIIGFLLSSNNKERILFDESKISERIQNQECRITPIENGYKRKLSNDELQRIVDFTENGINENDNQYRS